jgi:hypothetical protein
MIFDWQTHENAGRLIRERQEMRLEGNRGHPSHSFAAFRHRVTSDIRSIHDKGK